MLLGKRGPFCSCYERRQKGSEPLRAFSHSRQELFYLEVLKVVKEAVVDSAQSLSDQFANSMHDDMLCKGLQRFIWEHPTTTFVDIREEALHWSEEQEKPVLNPPVSQYPGKWLRTWKNPWNATPVLPLHPFSNSLMCYFNSNMSQLKTWPNHESLKHGATI